MMKTLDEKNKNSIKLSDEELEGISSGYMMPHETKQDPFCSPIKSSSACKSTGVCEWSKTFGCIVPGAPEIFR